jgi:hypothetical protein
MPNRTTTTPELTPQERRRYDLMIEAGGLDVEALDWEGRDALVWLVRWDNPTIEGVCQLLEAAHAAGKAAAR